MIDMVKGNTRFTYGVRQSIFSLVQIVLQMLGSTKVSGSRKDHILTTISFQSLCHWDPETAGSQSQKYVQLIM